MVQYINNEDMVTFYFLIWCFLLYLCIIYPFIRMAIKKMLRQRQISKTTIKRSLTGFKNFWWYEKLHTEHNLGIVYRINKVFVTIMAVSVVLQCLLGWWNVCSPIIAVCVCLSCLSASALGVFGAMQDRETAKQHFIVSVVFPLVICYVLCKYTIQMWN